MTAILLKKSSSFLYVFSAKMALKTVVFTLGFQYRIKKCDLDLALWSIPATLNRSPYHGFVLKNTIRAWRFDTFKMIIRTKNPRTPIESTIATRRVNIFGFYGGVGVRGVLPEGGFSLRALIWAATTIAGGGQSGPIRRQFWCRIRKYGILLIQKRRGPKPTRAIHSNWGSENRKCDFRIINGFSRKHVFSYCTLSWPCNCPLKNR